MLGNIALLFIQPETGRFTFNERSVHLNIVLTIIICALKLAAIELFYGQLYWILGVLIINLINLIHNVSVSYQNINKINRIIENRNIDGIELLFNCQNPELPETIEDIKREPVSPVQTNPEIIVQQSV